jgi:hypothetical protein
MIDVQQSVLNQIFTAWPVPLKFQLDAAGLFCDFGMVKKTRRVKSVIDSMDFNRCKQALLAGGSSKSYDSC